MLSDPWILRSAMLIRSKLYYAIQSVFCSIWLLSYSCYTDIHIQYIATVVQYGCIVIECYWYPIYYELPISITLLLWYLLFISTIIIIHIPYDNSYTDIHIPSCYCHPIAGALSGRRLSTSRPAERISIAPPKTYDGATQWRQRLSKRVRLGWEDSQETMIIKYES